MAPRNIAGVKKTVLKGKKKKIARMDEANKALCFAFRNPGDGKKPMELADIRKIARKTDGKKPSLQAIALAAKNFHTEKKKRGRKLGSCKTTKEEDKQVLQTFHKMRPPGHGSPPDMKGG